MNPVKKLTAKKRTEKTIEELAGKIDKMKALALDDAVQKDHDQEKEALLFGSNVEIIQSAVRKTYLPQIAAKYTPVSFDGNFSYYNRLRILKVNKWVTDRSEDPLDKLVNVYSALSNVDCSIALVYRRVKTGTDVYFVIVNQSDTVDPAVVDSYYNMFVSALRGNFPGAETEEVTAVGSFDPKQYDGIIDEWFSSVNSNAVAMITNIASESSEKFISQGIEKLLDGVVPQDEDSEYTLMLLAQPQGKAELNAERELYSEMYTQLSPFMSVQSADSISDAESVTKSVSDSISRSVSAGGSVSIGGNISITPFGIGFGGNASASANASISKSVSKTYGFTSSKTATKGETITSTRTNYRVKETLELIEKHIQRLQQGDALGMWKFSAYVLADNYSVAQSVSNMYRSLTEGEESFVESAAINIWNDNKVECKNAIETIKLYLRAFTHPRFALNGIEDGIAQDEQSETLVKTDVPEKKLNTDDLFTLPAVVSGFTGISGKEVAMAMNLPRAAVSGLPVIECAQFGRDVISQDPRHGQGAVIDLGNIFHMQQVEENKRVLLDAQCMTEHTFITGSTGAGKSTTIYRLLAEASELPADDDRNVTFMVVEPAKGEYRRAVAKISPRQPVAVYGTTPGEKGAQLLRINPFAFPVGRIHILEHLDRLIEIYNVCWPMYAAMPAVLKKGIEEAYRVCGWDLLRSENSLGNDIFPTFTDVCGQLRRVIDRSDYSADNKSDYKGALITRLESLTNGINGLIFTSDAIPDRELFDRNTVIDLSRVGAAETKSLIMGLLVMKLQEYRMANETEPNARLQHITVLEEAHNLLKRTSFEQSAESSNLQGKSVEMLSNSIAEMRTYGEAFVIADQAPGLLDMSVIRNTNTKIIMRLPDYSDRELVGKAANLNDDQIIEIAKLRPGVAAVYYNGWINPVLCKIPVPVPVTREAAAGAEAARTPSERDREEARNAVLRMIAEGNHLDDEHLDRLKKQLLRGNYPGELIAKVVRYCRGGEDKKLLSPIFYLLLSPSERIKELKSADSEQTSLRLADELGLSQLSFLNERLVETIILNLLHEQDLRQPGFSELYNGFSRYYENRYLR